MTSVTKPREVVLRGLLVTVIALLAGCTAEPSSTSGGETTMSSINPTLDKQRATARVVEILHSLLVGLPAGYRIAAASPITGLEALGTQTFAPCREGNDGGAGTVTTAIAYWVWLPAGTTALDGLDGLVRRSTELHWQARRTGGRQPEVQFGSVSTGDGYGFTLVTNDRGMLSVRAGSPCFLGDPADSKQLIPPEINRE